MTYPVVIVGAGPAGLMLAIELRTAGIEVVLLERERHATRQSRGLGLAVRTLELFDQRGLLSGLGKLSRTHEGHFGGIPTSFAPLEGSQGANKVIPQPDVERVLSQRAEELGADIRRCAEVTGLDQSDDSVDLEVNTPSGSTMLTASYVAGCDGGRSTVRRLLGIDFDGTSATRELFMVDIRGADLEERRTGEVNDRGMIMVSTLDNGHQRIVVSEHGRPPSHREAPDFSEVTAAWERITGSDISEAEPVWVSSFTDGARQARQYRAGRVFLVGDAAHTHLPSGGQGMNTSIQDAVNLGWKLGSVARGDAPDSLIDTYHTERHPVGRRLLMNTRAQGALFHLGASIEPIREILAELMAYDVVNRHMAAMVSGTEVCYPASGNHPLLGRRMPPQSLRFDDGRESTIAEQLRTGRGLLIDTASQRGIRETAAQWDDRVRYVQASVPSPTESMVTTEAVLIRPDGYVAWTDEGCDDDLPTVLTRWFGPATRGN